MQYLGNEKTSKSILILRTENAMFFFSFYFQGKNFFPHCSNRLFLMLMVPFSATISTSIPYNYICEILQTELY